MTEYLLFAAKIQNIPTFLFHGLIKYGEWTGKYDVFM